MTTIQNPIELTLYLVGYSKEDALGGMPFDSPDSAESYISDQGGKLYSVTAYIDPSTIETQDD